MGNGHVVTSPCADRQTSVAAGNKQIETLMRKQFYCFSLSGCTVAWVNAIFHLMYVHHFSEPRQKLNFNKQECISVGCVPPEAVAIRGVSTRHPLPPRREEAPPGRKHPPPGGSTPSGGSTPPGESTPPRRKHPPGGSTHPKEAPTQEDAPPVNKMTNRCKNITLPQTSFAGGNNRLLAKFRDWCPPSGKSWIRHWDVEGL